MSFLIRPARPEDAAQIAEFNCRLAEESEQLRLDRERVRAGVRALLADEARGRYLVAAEGPVLIGQLCITLEWSDWWNGWYWWIQSVFVRPEARKQGVFKALFEEIARQARAAGDVAAIRLYVEEHNTKARSVYANLGMRESGYRVLEMKLTSLQAPSGLGQDAGRLGSVR
jgi:GNAT superfamily N-acetyltransferase